MRSDERAGVQTTAERRRELMRRMMAEAGLGSGDAGLAPRESDGPAPLSYAQQSMWLHHRTFPDSPAYNVCLLIRMHGPLDTAALRDALRGLIRRHAVLRTTYSDAGDEMASGPLLNASERTVTGTPARPPQAATDDGAFGLLPVASQDADVRAVQVVGADDSVGLEPRACEDAEARAAELAAVPFDLRNGRPIRLELLRLGADEHALVLVVHHIAWDGMTWGSLSRDLSALYRSAVTGEPDGLWR